MYGPKCCPFNLLCSSAYDPKLFARRFLRSGDALIVGEKAIEGGQGRIFPGTMFGTPIAAKQYKVNSADIELEIGLLGRATHPNIIRLLAWCKKGQEQYLVMECAYEDLTRGLEHLGRLEYADRKNVRQRWVSEIAQALAWLHQSVPKIIHGDLRESNIMLSIHSEIKLIDFGLAGTSSALPVGNRNIRLRGELPSYAADMLAFGLVALRVLGECSEQFLLTEARKDCLQTWLDIFAEQARPKAENAMKQIYTQETRTFLQRCLSPIASTRPSAFEATERIPPVLPQSPLSAAPKWSLASSEQIK